MGRVEIWMSPEFIKEILTEGVVFENVTCIKGLPPEAEFVDCRYDVYRDVIMFGFKNVDIPEGQSFDAVYEKRYPDG